MPNEDRLLKDSNGREIIRRWVAPNPPEQLEHYHLYFVPGDSRSYLSPAKAWRRAKELANGKP